MTWLHGVIAKREVCCWIQGRPDLADFFTEQHGGARLIINHVDSITPLSCLPATGSKAGGTQPQCSMQTNDLRPVWHKLWAQTWGLGLPSKLCKSCELLMLFSGRRMEELIRLMSVADPCTSVPQCA